MRVLIVDDEKPVREAIRLLGDWSSIGAEQISEAENGEIAMRMILSGKPDLILIDMKMPVVSGLELLQWLESRHEDIVCIVISGYSDYEFTRQAIKSRVVDYLIKPVNRDSLNQALKNAAKIVKMRKQGLVSNTMNDDFQKSHSAEETAGKMKLINSVFEGSYDLRIRDMYGSFLAEEKESSYSVILLRIMNFRVIRNQKFGNDSDLLFFVINNVVEEVVTSENRPLCFQLPTAEQEIIIVLTCGHESSKDTNREIAGNIIGSLEKCLDLRAIAACSQSSNSILDLSAARNDMQNRLNRMNLLNIKPLTDYTDENSNEEPCISLMHYKDSLEQAVLSGRYEQIELVLQQFLDQMISSGYFSLGSAERVRQEMLYLFNSFALKYRSNNALPNSEELAASELASISQDYSNFQGFTDMIYCLANFYYNRIRRQNGRFEISDVRDYLASHFHEDITVSDLARRYFMSRGYLMKLFKHKYGTGIFEYLQQLRMDKARELLADPDIKIQYIAEITGFNDQNYFSKAFRHVTGQSPSEYRCNLNRNQV